MTTRNATAEGAVLRFFRLRKGVSRRELGRRDGSSARAIERLENGESPTSRKRLVHLLGLLGVPAGAADTALFADQLANPGGPARPSKADQLIEEALATGGWAGVQAARLELKVDCRRRRAPADRAWAEKAWSRLKKLAVKQLEKAIEVYFGDDRSWALVVRICEASAALASDRADGALRLARIASRLAEHDPWGEAWAHCLRGWVKPFEANALRVAGNFPAAKEAFARADVEWDLGKGGDPAGLLDEIRRLDLKASFLMYQDGQAPEAIVLLEQALAATTTNHTRSRLLIKQATVMEISGENQEALAVLREAEPLIDARRDPRLPCVLQFNRVVNYCALGCWQEAEQLLAKVEALAADLRLELDERRLLWLKGRACAGLGRGEAALRALTQVREYFLSKAIAYDFAVVSLEMATLHLEKGQTRLVQEIAKAMAWIFQGQRVHKEALAALGLFCEAAGAEEAEADWTRRLIKYLYRAQYNSKLHFDG